MAAKPDFRKPAPEGVVEQTGIGTGSGNGMVVLDDGSLMIIMGSRCHISTDGGQTWGEPRPLNCEAMGSPSNLSCIKLQSGKLALAHRGREEAGRGTEMFNWNPFYLSVSEDGGQTWTPILPNDLASSYSPPRLRRIPSTGDLLCVWNQVSRDEIKRGYRRRRLSAAISRDSGASWEWFKTIEVSDGMEDVERVVPQEPITPVVGLPEVGTLPEGFTTFDYPNVWFAGDKVYLTYHRSWVEADEDAREAVTLGERKGRARKPGEMVLRIYPLAEFYR